MLTRDKLGFFLCGMTFETMILLPLRKVGSFQLFIGHGVVDSQRFNDRTAFTTYKRGFEVPSPTSEAIVC